MIETVGLAALAVLANLLFLRSGNLFQPVAIDQFWWTLGLFALVKLARTEEPRWWIVFGISCGVGLLTKFSMLIFGFAVFLALLATPARRAFVTRWPWFAAAIAIVLGAAITFRLLGITAKHVEAPQKRWVFRVVSILGLAAILICFPLHQELRRSLVETKPQPRAYPLAKSVVDALEDHISTRPEVTLITAGRPSSHLAPSDVVLVLGTGRELAPEFADDLVEIVRQKMRDDTLIVEVHCVREVWQETSQ